MTDAEIESAANIALGVMLTDGVSASAEMLTGGRLRFSIALADGSTVVTRRIRADERTEEAVTEVMNGFVREAILGAFGPDIFRVEE